MYLVEHCFNNTKDWRCKYTYKDGILPDVPGSKGRSQPGGIEKSSDNK